MYWSSYASKHALLMGALENIEAWSLFEPLPISYLIKTMELEIMFNLAWIVGRFYMAIPTNNLFSAWFSWTLFHIYM